MVVLDATIVNVALPSIQHGLHFSATSLQWVVNVYTLFFGGFLLLGGRASDLFGRQRLFMAGLAVFTIASLVNGLAGSSGLLIAGRALDRDDHLFGGPRAHEGTWDLERDRRRRRRGWTAARRSAHRHALLALGLLHQLADRDRGVPPGGPLHREHPCREAARDG